MAIFLADLKESTHVPNLNNNYNIKINKKTRMTTSYP